MTRGIDEADAMVRSFEKPLAGLHGLEDAALPFDPEEGRDLVAADAAPLGDETNESLRRKRSRVARVLARQEGWQWSSCLECLA